MKSQCVQEEYCRAVETRKKDVILEKPKDPNQANDLATKKMRNELNLVLPGLESQECNDNKEQDPGQDLQKIYKKIKSLFGQNYKVNILEKQNPKSNIQYQIDKNKNVALSYGETIWGVFECSALLQECA